MNHQNIDENPCAPPKSAADFRQPEKGTKKQRIARVILGALSVPVVLTTISFLFFLQSSDTLNTAPFPFAVVLLFFLGLFFVLFCTIIPSIIFTIIIEYYCPTWIHKMIVAFLAGIGIVFLIHLGVFFTSDEVTSVGVRVNEWYVGGVFSTIMAVFIWTLIKNIINENAYNPKPCNTGEN